MKNVVECYKEFFGYFNALETNDDKEAIINKENEKIKRASHHAPICKVVQLFFVLFLTVVVR